MKTSDNAETKTILLVDDEDSLVIFLEKLLVRQNYNVMTARNGKEAVETYKANSNKIDLILMDISMPVMNGVEAHRALIEYDKDVSVLFMSGFSEEVLKDIKQYYFISKPMEPEELFETIRIILENTHSKADFQLDQ